ncbi:MAG: alcohol dehydrogenase [Spirochaetes bacterium RBG_13_68_11]|nr:MAG: alcohol dehydrogenase [Spirochaetes bacterium RBG_13_68_11]
MKAVRLVSVGMPLELFDVPVPAVGDRDVLVRVKAAGICHSDVHYRAGTSQVRPLPMTLGHEVAGVVEEVGRGAAGRLRAGDRVVLHYNLSCGDCWYCSTGNEQFCPHGLMLGHFTDGGYSEYVAVPARNALPLPPEIPFEQGATLMCASATSFHALRKARLRAGERAAVFGVGGLGMSAVQLARAFGAIEVFAVDLAAEKLALAEHYGACPVDAARTDPVEEIRRRTEGRGVDVALEMVGRASTMRQAVRSLAPMGRAVIVGIGGEPLSIDTYRELLGGEAEVIGSNDHLLQELPQLIEMARRGILDTSRVVTRTIPLDPVAINGALDALERYEGGIRTVIVP